MRERQATVLTDFLPSRDAIPVAREAIRVAREGGNLLLGGTVLEHPREA